MRGNLQDLLTSLILMLAFVAVFGPMVISVIAMTTGQERRVLFRMVILAVICISLMFLLGWLRTFV